MPLFTLPYESGEIYDHRSTYRDGCGTSISSSADAIGFALPSQETDPRDRVYGVLGLIAIPARGETLKPDYDLSACQVYHQAIHHIMLLPRRSIPCSGATPKKGQRDYHVPERCDGQQCGSLSYMFIAANREMRETVRILQKLGKSGLERGA